MKRMISVLSLAMLAGALFYIPAARAAQNVPLCFAIAENYNKCLRQHQRAQYWGGGGGWDGGGWGGGYGYHDDYEGYGGYPGDGYGHHRARRNQRAQAQCAIWIAQMQASGCY